MKLIELKCKSCGANLKANEEQKSITCQYCKAKFKLDDEVQHIKYDDMEQAGYEFEKGRIKAQNENRIELKQTNTQNKTNKWLILAWIFLFPFMLVYFILTTSKLTKEQKRKILWILGWIFFFPAPLSVLIWKSKYNKTVRILLLVLLWGGLIILGNIMPSETTNTETNKENSPIKEEVPIENNSNKNENNKSNEPLYKFQNKY